MSDVSPDVTQYVDLTIYDADPSTLVAQALTTAAMNWPDWKQAQTDTGVVLYQGAAVIIAELMYAANRLPGACVSTLLQLFGIEQGTGTPATATVTLTAMDTGGYTVPAGTRLGLPLADGTTATFTVDAATAIPAGQTTATADVTDAVAESVVNGTPAGTALEILDQVYFLDSASLATSPTGGVDPETNADWLNRGAMRLRSISSTLVTAADFTVAALLDTADGIFRATTTDLWNPTLASGAGGTQAGAVTVSVIGEGGTAITSGGLTNLQSILAAACVAGLAVYVEAPTVTAIDVAGTVWQQPGYTTSQVQENIAAQLAAPVSEGGAGLSTDQWPWGASVRYNDLVTVITNTPGVAYVAGNLTSPTADVALPGVGPLATLGTVTFTVEGP